MRLYYLHNKEYLKEHFKKHYQKNKVSHLLKSKQDYEDNKEHYKELNHIRRLKYGKKYFNDYNKEYRQTEKYKKYRREYAKQKYKDDIQYRLRVCLRTRLYCSIKNRTIRSHKLLGCSIAHLKEHLEKQFKPGMTWKTYGSYWEIDHIKPCFSFDLTKLKEQLKCFNYKNLQPLTVTQNRSKGSH